MDSTLSSQTVLVFPLSPLHFSSAPHFWSASSCHEWDRKASTSPRLAFTVLACSPVSVFVLKSFTLSEPKGSPRKVEAPCLSASSGLRPPTRPATVAAALDSPT